MMEMKVLRVEIAEIHHDRVAPELRRQLDVKYGADAYLWDGIEKMQYIHRVNGPAWDVRVKVWLPC